MAANIASIQGYAVSSSPNGAMVASIQGYAVVAPSATMNLRRVGGYSMVATPNSVNLRRVMGYSMSPYMPLPVNMTGKDALMAMASRNLRVPTPIEQFIFGDVLTNTDPLYNAKISVKASPQLGLVGQMDLWFNRVLMNRLPDFSGVSTAGITSTVGLLPRLNAVAGVILTADDIVDEPISPNQTALVLTAKSTSYLFIPGSTIPVGQATSLATAAPTTALTGFTPAG